MPARESPKTSYKSTYLKDTPVFQNTVPVTWFEPEPPTLSFTHCHEFIEVSLVIAGSGRHRVWNEIRDCAKGDMYILNTGVPHSYYAKPNEEELFVTNLLFDPSDLFTGAAADPESPDFCFGIFREIGAYAFLSLKSRQLDQITGLHQRILNERAQSGEYWLEAVRAHLITFLITVRRLLTESGEELQSISPKDKNIVKSAARYVMENYADSSMTLESIAHSLYISKSYLSRVFRKVTGEYFADYVRNIRMQQACHLLEQTRMTNEQIVYNCGLRDIPTFYRLFKQQYNQTPNQYRAANNK